MAGVKATILLVLIAAVSAFQLCNYDRKGRKWSPCDPVLQVKTKTISLREGKKECLPTKTLTRSCKGRIGINGCQYVPVSSWGDCDPVTITSVRLLELRSGAQHGCADNEAESKDCVLDNRNEMEGDRRNSKKRKYGLTVTNSVSRCSYRKGEWGGCNPVTLQKVRTLELRKGPASCKKKRKESRRCRPGREKAEANKERRERKRTLKMKKNRHRKQKHRHDKLLTPPKLTEMTVWPLSTSVEVSWKPPDQGTVHGYKIGYGISIPDVYSIDVNSSVLHHVITYLEPEQEYIVSLRARNQAGFGSPLYETVRTGRDKDSGNNGHLLLAPVELTASAVSANAVEVAWTDSSVVKLRAGGEDAVGKVYTVRYMQLNHLSSHQKPKYVMVNTTELSLMVEGLRPNTRYEFAVRVTQGAACSVWSMSIVNTTLPSAPSAFPADFTVDLDPSNPFTVKVTWSPPEEPNGHITGYILFYSKDHILPEAAWATSIVKGNQLSTSISDLEPNSTYFFKIQARNSDGVGPTSPHVIVTVPDGTGLPKQITAQE